MGLAISRLLVRSNSLSGEAAGLDELQHLTLSELEECAASAERTAAAADLGARCRDAALRVRRLRNAPVVLMPANQDAGSRPPAISHAHRNLARVACALAACALTVWINTPVAIPPLVALVRDGTDDQKVSAASALRYLAWRPDNSEAIRRAGGIPPLVALVRDGNDDQKVSAADALRILARGSDNYVVLAIAKAGGIPPLVALLCDGNDAQKATAARALGNLEYEYCDSDMDYDDDEEYFDHRIAIAKAGGIPPLVALVRDGNAKQRESAVGALGDLAVNDDNKNRIEEASVIPPLMALVRDGNAKQRESAAGALENLAVNDNKILIT